MRKFGYMFKILLQKLSLNFLQLHSMPEYGMEMKDKDIETGGDNGKTLAAKMSSASFHFSTFCSSHNHCR